MTDFKFSNNFWDNDFLGTNGFEALSKRCKEGRQTCKELEDFFRLRAKIEEDYSISLINLSKRKEKNFEFGTTKQAIECLRLHTSNIGHQHQQLSKEYNQLVTSISEFRLSQKNAFKKEETILKKIASRRQEQHKKTAASRLSFEKCSLEQETVDAHVEQCRVGGATSLSNKDMEKNLHRQIKIQTDCAKHNAQYKEDLTILEILRSQWNKDMTCLADVVEKLEDNRLKFFRDELWTYLNLISCSMLTVDKFNDHVREILLSVNIQDDINEFVKLRRTGCIQPPKINYDANNRQNVFCR